MESAVVSYLLTTDVAALVSNRIYVDIPEEVVYPFVRVRLVSQADIPAQSGRHWVTGATLQVEGWEHRRVVSARATARDLCETAVAALHDAVGFNDGIVLGRGFVLNGATPRYDPETQNPRFTADVRIPYHPVPS